MKAVVTFTSWASDLVGTLWTPIFVGLFLAIVVYAVWPGNRRAFDAAAKMPLRED